jgi:hypothetical protein
MVWVLSGSEDSGLDDFLDEEGEGEGTVYVSRLLLERARRSCKRCGVSGTQQRSRDDRVGRQIGGERHSTRKTK